MLLLNKVIPSSEGHQMSIVCRGRYGDRASTPDVSVTQLVGEALKLIAVEVVVIPQDVVVAGSTGALNALVRTQVEVKLCWVSDANIYGGASRNVATLATLLLLVGTEQSCVVPLLDSDVGYARLVICLQLDAGLPHGSELMLQDGLELSLANTVTVQDDPVGLEPR